MKQAFSKTIVIRFSRDLNPGSVCTAYGVAGCLIIADRPMMELSPFRLDVDDTPKVIRDTPTPKTDFSDIPAELVFDGEVWVANATRQVKCLSNEFGLEVQISGIGKYSISSQGQQISLLQAAPGIEDSLLVEAILGPALMLALAAAGIFSLHASAVAWRGKALLFTGDSGAGKSTLAELLQCPGRRVERVADDICPFGHAGHQFFLLPDFPQLKIPASEQSSGKKSKALPVGAIYDLHRRKAGDIAGSEVARHKLQATEAFKCLVGQSVASRLFPEGLMRPHTRTIAEMVRSIPVYRLVYPSGVEHTDAVREYLHARTTRADSRLD